jgi:hypothetical protein
MGIMAELLRRSWAPAELMGLLAQEDQEKLQAAVSGAGCIDPCP